MDAEVIIVGGGVVGLWTAYHLASQGVKTILFEQFPYPHTRGSSHGQSRIIRTAYCDEEYSAMMPESYRRWRELENEARKELLLKTGLITLFDMEDPDEIKAFNRMLFNLQKYAPRHEIIAGNYVKDRIPGLMCDSKYMALYDSEAGLLKADKCLQALQELFLKHGGTLHDHECVLSIKPINASRIEVVTSVRKYFSKSVVISSGSYTNKLLQSLNMHLPLTVMKASVLYWKDTSTSQKYSLLNGFPATSMHQGNSFYSIPAYEYPGMMKICYNAFVAVDPERRNAVTSEIKEKEEKRMEHFREEIRQNFPDIDSSEPVIQESCIYTRTPDWNFVIDRHPRFNNIVVGAGFSGHGFKTAPAVGHMLANLAIGVDPPYQLEPFSMSRFQRPRL